MKPLKCSVCRSSSTSTIQLSFQKRYFTTKKDFHYDIAIVGGGIVGLATARQILLKNQNTRLVVLEKEHELGSSLHNLISPSVATHQSKNNSGVIHAGIYYVPNSKRAKFCVEGNKRMFEYCNQKQIPHKKCGKLIVAVKDEELEGLDKLYKRGLQNGVQGLKILDAHQIQHVEPHIKGKKAIFSPNSGIVDFSVVAKSFAEDVKAMGGEFMYKFEADLFEKYGENEKGVPGVKITAKSGRTLTCQYMVTCSGIYADRIAVKTGCKRDPITVPLRGEWRVLKPEHTNLINGLVYPVPDPRYPWLGVHFTKKINGEVWMGPNAVIATSKEGYSYWNVNLTDLWDMLSYSGFRRLLQNNVKTGIHELYNSIFLSPYLKQLQEYMPSLTASHIGTQTYSGVRPLAVDDNGKLVDDFFYDSNPEWPAVFHVRNTPSPAATSSLAIAEEIVDMLERHQKSL